MFRQRLKSAPPSRREGGGLIWSALSAAERVGKRGEGANFEKYRSGRPD